MWDETDTFGRWVQGICAIFLGVFALGDAYLLLHGLFSPFYLIASCSLLGGSAWLCWRCARYAITGRGNVNRDNY